MIKIGVMGSGSCDGATLRLAEQVGHHIAESGALLICGGLGGVMEAACRGAQSAGGTTVGILPGEYSETANAYVQIPIPTGLGQARNVINIHSSDAIIAVKGEYGTLSEIAIALKVGVPVVGLNTWKVHSGTSEFQDPIIRASNPKEAVRLALAAATKK